MFSGNEIPYLLLNLFLCHSGVFTESLAPFTLLNTLLILPAISFGAISCLTSVLNIGASFIDSLTKIVIPPPMLGLAIYPASSALTIIASF